MISLNGNGKKNVASSGLSLMAKTLGIDPAEIMGEAKNFGRMAKQIVEALENIQSRLAAIEAKLGIEVKEDGQQQSIAGTAGAGNGRRSG